MKFGCCASAKLYREVASAGYDFIELPGWEIAEYTDEEFELRARKYDYARPFTKESLLYREIFEKYYPGQAQMIAGFWMPNKTWKGCDVNDPSARVLSNYGESGR